MPRAGVAAGRPLSPDEGQARSWADLLALADDGDPEVRHEESTVQVVLAVDADADPWGDDDVLVDDGPMDRGVATDIDEVEQDAVGDLRVAVDLHTGGEHRMGHVPTADHHTGRDCGVDRLTDAALRPEDELGRRIVAVVGVDRPFVVVEVEHGMDRDEVHLGVVVGVDGADVTPVAVVAFAGAGDRVVLDVIDVGQPPVYEVRDDVATHVPPAPGAFRITDDGVDEDVGIEDIDAHRGQNLVRGVRQADRVRGLLEEGRDLAWVGGLDLDDTELVGDGDGLPDRRDCYARAVLDVLLDHMAEVHAIDVVRAHHHDDVGVLVVHEVQALVDRVGAAAEPALVDALLGRHRCHVVAEHRRHAPGLADVTVEAVRLVLGENDDLEIPRVHDVAECEVDQPVDTTERHRRLGTVRGQGQEPLAPVSYTHLRAH